MQARPKPLIRETQPYSKKIVRGIWVEPSLLAEVEYRAKSAGSKVRHPWAFGRTYELARGLDMGTVIVAVIVAVLLGVLAAAYLLIQNFMLG